MKRAYGYALFTVVSYAFAPNFFKKIISGMEFSDALFYFLAFGALSCFGYLCFKKKLSRTIQGLYWWEIFWLALAGIANYLNFLLYTYSLSITNAATVIVLVKISPIIQILIAPLFLKQKMEKLRATLIFFSLGLFGTAVAAVGNSIVTKGESFQVGLSGNTLPILAGCCNAFHIVFLVKFIKKREEKVDAGKFYHKFFGWGLLWQWTLCSYCHIFY